METTLRGFTRALSKALVSEQAAMQPGLLQKFDPRVRVIGLLSLVVAVVFCKKLPVIAGLLSLAIVIAVASKVSIKSLAKRVWLVVFGFTGIIALPALFVTPGEPLFRLPVLPLYVSAQGLSRASVIRGMHARMASIAPVTLIAITRFQSATSMSASRMCG